MDHYATLGVAKTATPEEIKKAYRKLASQHHPDKGGDTAMFQKIEEAYRILSDPNQRQQYDNPMPQGNPFGAHGFNFNFNGADINDLFGQFFNQHQQRHPGAKQVYRTALSITLEQSYQGGTQNLKIQTHNSSHVITIDIPKGVENGSQVRYENLIPNSSLIVEFRLQPHLKFERKGTDLFCNQPVSVLDLIVGGSFEFTTISGKTLEVTVPAGTQPNKQLKIAGEGMPINGTPQYGDQIILFKPFIPDKINSEIVDAILKHKNY
jgi:curved DNA-binding protein